MNRKRSEEMHLHAKRVMPGGVSSPVRAFQGVGGIPITLERGEGPRVWDADGNAYVDFQQSFGPLILGHAHPRVVQAVADAAARGTTFGAPCREELELAERITQHHPAAKWVRFVNSGTEAVMSATRLARAATRREIILKFEGCYHGHADAFLVKGGSGLATFGVSTSAGVPSETVRHTAVLPLDDEEQLDAFFAEHGRDLACAVIEGVPANNGLLPQRRDFYRLLEERCRETGALLIVDEVITGFRLGWAGATAHYGLMPDLVTFGKVIGGGLPVGAYGGRAELMEHVSPLGPMYQAGTLSGNPVAMAAGLATLNVLKAAPNPFQELDVRTARFVGDVERALQDAGLPARIPRVGSLFWLLLQDGDEPVRRPDQVTPEAVDRYKRLHRALLEEGVYLAPSAYEVAFMSLTHDPDTLAETVDAFTRAAARVAREVNP